MENTMLNTSQQTSGTTSQFKFEFLKKITNDFSEDRIIGCGAYGVVYKGVMDNGEKIAVKKLKYMPPDHHSEKQFHNECTNLMRVQHQNIVRLVGYCDETHRRCVEYNGEYVFADENERALCFEYLQGGNLEKHVSDGPCKLDWDMCYKIIKGVCEGLNHLHNGYKYCIFHLDLKPANILLDNYMIPRIGDFGLSRLFSTTGTCTTTTPLGTMGYTPPEYVDKQEISPKFDVFSLGVVIIHIMAGRKHYYDHVDTPSKIIELVCENWRKRLHATMWSHASQEVKTCIETALTCVEPDRRKRLTISQIVDKLNNIDIPKFSLPYKATNLQTRDALGHNQYANSGPFEMAAMAYSLLKEVHEGAQNWRIRTRVARLWEHRDDKKDGELIQLHMVLVDEKGEGIHAYVPKAQIPKFQPLLREATVYYFQYFETSPATRPFRPTFHNCELRFISWTRVTEIGPVRDDFPLYAYRLRSFTEIIETVTDKTYLADVIGLITGISDVATFDVSGAPKAKRNLRLVDGRHTAIVVLWGELTGQIDADDLIRRSQREPIILLAMGCTFKMQDSMLTLTPSYGSQICINHADASVSAFRNRIIGIDHSIERIAERGHRFAAAGIENTSVPDLATLIPNEAMNRKFRCKIEVQAIAPNQSWWYRACDRCGCGAVEDGDAFRCTSKDCNNRSASPRYKLGIKAADEEAVVDMIFFGDVAMDLIGKPADVLVNEFLASDALMPPDISRLVGRSYVVDVVVSRFSFRRENIDFRVLKFYTEGGSEYTEFASVGTSSSSSSGVLQIGTAMPVAPAAVTVTEVATADAGLALPAGAQALAAGSLSSTEQQGTVSGEDAPLEETVPSTPASEKSIGEPVEGATPPEKILEATAVGTEATDTDCGAKATETLKKKRGRGAGEKPPSAKKGLFPDRVA